MLHFTKNLCDNTQQSIIGEILSDWWIYENWTVERGGKAIIHNAGCSFCRDGKGIHRDSSDRNGRWLGPFASREAAYGRAKQLNRARTDFCKFCANLT